MKSKHLLLILLLAAMMPQIAKAQVYETVATTEDFEYVTGIPEDGLPTVMPNGWNRISDLILERFRPGVTNNLCNTNPTTFLLNLIGNNFLFLGSAEEEEGPLNILILPYYDRVRSISFLAWTDVANEGYLQVGYITNINDASTFVALQTGIQPHVGREINQSSQATYSYSLSNIPDNARLAFKWIRQTDPSVGPGVSFTLIDNPSAHGSR